MTVCRAIHIYSITEITEILDIRTYVGVGNCIHTYIRMYFHLYRYAMLLYLYIYIYIYIYYNSGNIVHTGVYVGRNVYTCTHVHRCAV